MQNLVISCDCINSIDAQPSRTLKIELIGVDLDFLYSVPSRDIIRNTDAEKLLQEYSFDTIIQYLESNGYAVTS